MTSNSRGNLEWRRAKSCESGACVEIATLTQLVMIRSSVDPDGTCIALNRDEWQEFVSSIKNGDFDGP